MRISIGNIRGYRLPKIILIYFLLLIAFMLVVAFGSVDLYGIGIPVGQWWVVVPVILVGVFIMPFVYNKKIKVLSYVIVITIIAVIAIISSNAIGGMSDSNISTSKKDAKLAKQTAKQLAEEQKPVPCAMKEKDELQAIDGLKLNLFVLQYKYDSKGVIDFKSTSDTKTLSLNDLKQGANAGSLDVVALSEVPNDNTREYAVWLQVCSSNNMTKQRNDLPDIVDGSTIVSPSTMQYVSIQNIDAIPLSKGKYRIDGYIYADKKWQLVSRLNDIEFKD